MEPVSGGLVLLRQQTPLTRRLLVYFAPARTCCRAVAFCRHEVSFSTIHGKQIRDHLPGYSQGRAIGIAFLLLPFMDQSQLMVLVWAPTLRLPPAHAGYVCCAVWKAVFAGPCLRNSFLLRTVRNS